MTYRANARREGIRRLAGVRARLGAAEDALATVEASLKEAETRFTAADDRMAAADALHAACADREQARRDRHAARQAHERASANGGATAAPCARWPTGSPGCPDPPRDTEGPDYALQCLDVPFA